MARPIIQKIDLRKIPDGWVFNGAKGDYIDCIVYENDEVDPYGNSHVIKLSPPRELREQGVKAVIIGNGKWMPQKGEQQREAPAPRQQPPPARRPATTTRKPPPGTIEYPKPETLADGMEDEPIPF